MDWSLMWLVLAIMLFIVELFTLGIFLLFFGFGALLTALISALFTISHQTQILFFLSTSIVSLLILRRPICAWLKITDKRHRTTDNIEDILGREGVVTKAITPPVHGQVDLSGTVWKARAVKPIESGVKVRVVNRENLVLVVESLD